MASNISVMAVGRVFSGLEMRLMKVMMVKTLSVANLECPSTAKSMMKMRRMGRGGTKLTRKV